MNRKKARLIFSMTGKSNLSIICFIPARSGSKRVANKNIRHLGGKPLIAYTIIAAKHSGIFEDIVVSTDSQEIADISKEYGALAPFLRPAEFAQDLSPDIEWVSHAINELKDAGKTYDAFCILRPTSPFRSGATIRRAWDVFQNAGKVDSLRAVEKCKQHPAKMWMIQDNRMKPVLSGANGKTPWHSCQYQSLPEIYVQNASLEIAWTKVALETETIAGNTIVPFYTEGYEGFDINTQEDWGLAETLLEKVR